MINCIKNFFNKLRIKFRRKRKLKGEWRLETIEQLKILHGLEAENELVQLLVEEIEKEKNNDSKN